MSACVSVSAPVCVSAYGDSECDINRRYLSLFCRSLSIRPLFEMLEGQKTSKLLMTRLQDEEAEAAPAAEAPAADAAAGEVSFPEDYPNSVRVCSE